MTITSEKKIMGAAEISRTLKRMSYEIIDRNNGPDKLALVGLQTRGIHIARRIAESIGAIENVEIPVGVLDVTMYRDDFRIAMKQPSVQVTSIPFEVEGITVVIIDDVFYTGRTVRCALDALMDFGRPARVRLGVLIDRGHRELPLIADFVGKKIRTASDQEIRAHVREVDGKDEVTLVNIDLEGGK